MGIRDIKAVNRTFNELKLQMEMMRDSLSSNTQEVAKINHRVEEAKRIEAEKTEGDWAIVEEITEEDRYPMIKTSEPGINIEVQISAMKKLDII